MLHLKMRTQSLWGYMLCTLLEYICVVGAYWCTSCPIITVSSEVKCSYSETQTQMICQRIANTIDCICSEFPVLVVCLGMNHLIPAAL